MHPTHPGWLQTDDWNKWKSPFIFARVQVHFANFFTQIAICLWIRTNSCIKKCWSRNVDRTSKKGRSSKTQDEVVKTNFRTLNLTDNKKKWNDMQYTVLEKTSPAWQNQILSICTCKYKYKYICTTVPFIQFLFLEIFHHPTYCSNITYFPYYSEPFHLLSTRRPFRLFASPTLPFITFNLSPSPHTHRLPLSFPSTSATYPTWSLWFYHLSLLFCLSGTVSHLLM